MNILFIGDIVGSSGRKSVREKLAKIKKENSIDFCIANGENAAAGLGLTRPVANELFETGIDALTMGNHTWSKSDIFSFIDSEKRIARPANVSKNWPGQGFILAERNGVKIIIINLVGRVGMNPADCPFEYGDELIPELKKKYNTKVVIVDFHAEATSEKQAFGRYFDGRVSLVVGTHTHVQTSDECIYERGTGFITDVGMTGPINSILGMDIDASISRFVDKLPVSYKVADGPAVFSAVIAEIDNTTGQTKSIRRILEF